MLGVRLLRCHSVLLHLEISMRTDDIITVKLTGKLDVLKPILNVYLL